MTNDFIPDARLDLAAQQAARKKDLRAAVGNYEAMPERMPTTEESQKVAEDVAKFVADYPQIAKVQENVHALQTWNRAKNFKPTYESFVAWFADQALESIILNPEAVGISGFGTKLIGSACAQRMTSGQIQKLISPKKIVTPETELDKLSADDYKSQYLEDPTDVPASVLARIERDTKTFAENEPTFLPTASNRELILDYIRENNLRICLDSFNAAFQYLRNLGKLDLEESNEVRFGVSRLITGKRKSQRLEVPPQEIEIVERTKKLTLQQINAADAETYKAWLSDPQFARQIDELI